MTSGDLAAQRRAEWAAALERACPADESLITSTTMWSLRDGYRFGKREPVPKPYSRTVALTSRCLRFIERVTKYGTPLPEVKSQFAIPLHEIKGFGTGRQAKTFLRRGGVSIDFTWTGGKEEWWCEAPNGPKVVAAIDAAIRGTVVAQQANLTVDAVGQLAALVDEGLLSKDEFERAKDGFIGRPPSKSEDAIGMLRQLYSLKQAGVLSESEFNMKKWDVLSRNK